MIVYICAVPGHCKPRLSGAMKNVSSALITLLCSPVALWHARRSQGQWKIWKLIKQLRIICVCGGFSPGAND